MSKVMALTAIGVTVATAVAAAAAAGGADREKIRLNGADQAAARAVVLQRSDVGSAKTWKGGMRKPDLSPPPTCANFHPKQSDLVLTGAAESDYHLGQAMDVDTEAQVLQTARMVSLDWQREVTAPGVLPCLRSTLARSLTSGATIVSFRWMPYPHAAKYTAALRAVVRGPAKAKQATRLVFDEVLIGKGRTEITLSMSGQYVMARQLATAERSLGRVLASRVTR